MGGWKIGGTRSVSVSFEWGPDKMNLDVTGPEEINYPGDFSYQIDTTLIKGQSYYFRAKAVGVRTSSGDYMSFIAP